MYIKANFYGVTGSVFFFAGTKWFVIAEILLFSTFCVILLFTFCVMSGEGSSQILFDFLSSGEQ